MNPKRIKLILIVILLVSSSYVIYYSTPFVRYFYNKVIYSLNEKKISKDIDSYFPKKFSKEEHDLILNGAWIGLNRDSIENICIKMDSATLNSFGRYKISSALKNKKLNNSDSLGYYYLYMRYNNRHIYGGVLPINFDSTNRVTNYRCWGGVFKVKELN